MNCKLCDQPMSLTGVAHLENEYRCVSCKDYVCSQRGAIKMGNVELLHFNGVVVHLKSITKEVTCVLQFGGGRKSLKLESAMHPTGEFSTAEAQEWYEKMKVYRKKMDKLQAFI